MKTRTKQAASENCDATIALTTYRDEVNQT